MGLLVCPGMLYSPNVPNKSHHHRLSSSNMTTTRSNLKSRLFTSIFGLFIITILLLFILFIFQSSLSPHSWDHQELKYQEYSPNNINRNMKKIQFPLHLRKKYNHLIIVPGHAVLKISEISHAKDDENAWYLLDYQLGQGFPQIIHSHIQKAIEIASSDMKSILIFSGGQTREDVGPLSEAASYYYYAKYYNLFPSSLVTGLEEYARDSYENILFSICRFHEISKTYPDIITVVGFDFKSHRFTDIIRKAIKFPESQFHYIGVQPDLTLFHYENAIHGEQTVYHSLEQDMYGCNTPELRNKREERDPYKRTIPYTVSCPELSELLSWCESTLYPGVLPWIEDGNI